MIRSQMLLWSKRDIFLPGVQQVSERAGGKGGKRLLIKFMWFLKEYEGIAIPEKMQNLCV